MIDRIFKFFSSLRLTVVCLAMGVILVFLGTLAQVDEGLYLAQSRWFRSFFIWWGPQTGGWQIPIFPGGYLIGSVLLLNLVAAHLKRFQLSWKKLGINVTHFGIILLLAGQLATDMLSRETQVHFSEGETKQYSESVLKNELVFMTDAANPKEDTVVSIPEKFLAKKEEIHSPQLPFTARVKEYYINSFVRRRGPMVDKGPPPATQGIGPEAAVEPQAETRDPDEHNMPSAVIELIGEKGSLGTWLVSSQLSEPQEIQVGDKTWRVALRGERQYLPYTIQLLKTTHEVYPGTDIPKNFQSRVRIENPGRGENREVDIYMNNPLRYEGLTFYQYQMGRDQVNANRGNSALQVVRNPSWLTPYVGCLLVGGGMAIQFLMHLVGFISKRRSA
jgi:ResB-like family